MSSELMGCQKRCPFCRSKCCLPDNEHQQCETEFHYFCGYSGVSEYKTNKILFDKCTSKLNLDCKFYTSYQKFANGFKYLENMAPNWIDSINKIYSEGNEEFISKKEKKCAIAIKEILLKEYHLKNNEKYKQWEKLIPKEQILHAPIKIEGYLLLE